MFEFLYEVRAIEWGMKLSDFDPSSTELLHARCNLKRCGVSAG